MVEHVNYSQEKYTNKTKTLNSTCDLKLRSDENVIVYIGDFTFEFFIVKNIQVVRYYHELNINKITGDIRVTYIIENNRNNTTSPYNNIETKNEVINKKNSFCDLESLCTKGFVDGEKKTGYWGLKYHRAVRSIFEKIKLELSPTIENPHTKEKTYETFVVSDLYDLIVDFHLDKKKIKGHDNVYSHIKDEYPKKRWLKVNENKFLPALLDGYGIKSKYLVSELSLPENEILNIRTLAYLCKLFGENHIEYVKNINWNKICKIRYTPKKFHECKNDSEKKNVISIIRNWNKIKVRTDSPVESIYELFNLREFLEESGYDLRIKTKTPEEIDDQMAEWMLYKKHLSRGYREKYNIPQYIVDEIEQPFVYKDKEFTVKVLLCEEDFILEGYRMKNCMAKQFIHGSIYWFISLSHKSTTINLQFRKETYNQGYGKANTPINELLFRDAINIITQRLENYSELTWEKIRYDIVKK